MPSPAEKIKAAPNSRPPVPIATGTGEDSFLKINKTDPKKMRNRENEKPISINERKRMPVINPPIQIKNSLSRIAPLAYKLCLSLFSQDFFISSAGLALHPLLACGPCFMSLNRAVYHAP